MGKKGKKEKIELEVSERRGSKGQNWGLEVQRPDKKTRRWLVHRKKTKVRAKPRHAALIFNERTLKRAGEGKAG